MTTWTVVLTVIFILGLFSYPKESDSITIWTHNISLWVLMICITILVIADKVLIK